MARQFNILNSWSD